MSAYDQKHKRLAFQAIFQGEPCKTPCLGKTTQCLLSKT